MTDWLISVPCWGADHAKHFLSGPAQSIARALKWSGADATLLLHTDQPIDLTGFPAQVVRRPPPEGTKYRAFAVAHRDAIAFAEDGQAVSLLCSDTVISRETFAACRARLDQGYGMIAAFGPPTLPPPPSESLKARDLLAWATTPDRLHPRHRHYAWPSRSATPTCIYFRDDAGGVVVRAFHQHPMAVLAGPEARSWLKGTCDAGLETAFGAEKIWTMTDPDEMAIIEVSPPTVPFTRRPWRHTPGSAARAMRNRQVNPTQIELFRRRIILAGDGRDAGDEAVAAQIIRYLEASGPCPS